jgi:hypothetical protein
MKEASEGWLKITMCGDRAIRNWWNAGSGKQDLSKTRQVVWQQHVRKKSSLFSIVSESVENGLRTRLERSI